VRGCLLGRSDLCAVVSVQPRVVQGAQHVGERGDGRDCLEAAPQARAITHTRPNKAKSATQAEETCKAQALQQTEIFGSELTLHILSIEPYENG
jgi:hypothetical protein